MGNKVLGLLNLYDSPTLGELTKKRTTGSTSFLGRYAIMDFALSNFTNSSIDEINILVKDNYRSVAKHIGSLKTWVNNTKIGRQNILMNERGIRDPKFNSDLNAIRENDWVYYESDADYIIIAPAHIITIIDYNEVLKFHKEKGADITLVYTKIKNGTKAFLSSNVCEVKDNVVTFLAPNKGEKDDISVSMRTYVISRDAFLRIIRHKDYRDALSIRMLMETIVANQSLKVYGYEHKGYVRCIDSFEHFIEYSFELLDYKVATQLFDQGAPIYTRTHSAPPTNYGEKAVCKNCYLANGGHIEGSVKNSIVSRYVEIGPKAKVDHSILLTKAIIGEGVRVEYAVVDKYAKIYKDVIGTKDEPVYVAQGKVIK
ncbi:MAG: glucose-1-phosphate adenylyltransferase subunit GlgD [Bacilli bacterium]|nr:glucose-1-phosphate adenylyltransferase subunit GlgD [Bacilli bacterium]